MKTLFRGWPVIIHDTHEDWCCIYCVLCSSAVCVRCDQLREDVHNDRLSPGSRSSASVPRHYFQQHWRTAGQEICNKLIEQTYLLNVCLSCVMFLCLIHILSRITNSKLHLSFSCVFLIHSKPRDRLKTVFQITYAMQIMSLNDLNSSLIYSAVTTVENQTAKWYKICSKCLKTLCPSDASLYY